MLSTRKIRTRLCPTGETPQRASPVPQVRPLPTPDSVSARKRATELNEHLAIEVRPVRTARSCPGPGKRRSTHRPSPRRDTDLSQVVTAPDRTVKLQQGHSDAFEQVLAVFGRFRDFCWSLSTLRVGALLAGRTGLHTLQYRFVRAPRWDFVPEPGIVGDGPDTLGSSRCPRTKKRQHQRRGFFRTKLIAKRCIIVNAVCKLRAYLCRCI